MVRAFSLTCVLFVAAVLFYIVPIGRESRAQVANARNAMPTVGNVGRPANGYSSIRDVDFRNFDYPRCDGPDVVLRNGKHQYGDMVYDLAEFKSAQYVDFDGDGKQEAFVVVDWSSSGSVGGGVNAYVFAIGNGSSPVAIWSRCEGRSSAKLIGKSISFNYPEYIGDDPNCCPTYQTTDTIAWRKGSFVRIAKRRKPTGYKN